MAAVAAAYVLKNGAKISSDEWTACRTKYESLNDLARTALQKFVDAAGHPAKNAIDHKMWTELKKQGLVGRPLAEQQRIIGMLDYIMKKQMPPRDPLLARRVHKS